MHSEHVKEPVEEKGYTGRDVLYREGAVGLFDVQRAADALLRQGRKPSVAGIRAQLGGGSPNTITPLLAKYWQKLGERLAEGPESLERVPEALARVTELLWRRALEEARERLKIVQSPDTASSALEELHEQIGKLSVSLAEARGRETEQFSHLTTLSRERETLKAERRKLLTLLKGTQALLKQQTSRSDYLQRDLRRIAPLQPRVRRDRSAKEAVARTVGHTRGKTRKPKKRKRGPVSR